MANIKSQKKRIITNEKAHQRNVACKSELKTAVRRVREAVAAGNGAEAYAAALYASRLLDKAASKGIIHKNQAANRKSGVMKLANTIVTDADRAAYVKPEPKKQEATGNKKAARKAERKAALAAASAEKAKRREKQLKQEGAPRGSFLFTFYLHSGCRKQRTHEPERGHTAFETAAVSKGRHPICPEHEEGMQNTICACGRKRPARRANANWRIVSPPSQPNFAVRPPI